MKPVEVPEDLRQLLEDFVTPAEAASLLGWTMARLQSRINQLAIATLRAGSAVLIPHSEIERLRGEQEATRTKPDLSTCAPLKDALRGYVSLVEAARQLNLHPTALRSRIQHGTCQAIRVGSGVMVPVSEIKRIRFERWPVSEIPQRIVN
jgi:hypothetical protein